MTGPMPEDNPFSILGLPPTFALEDSTIERAYLKKVSQLHPDAGGQGIQDAEIDSWEESGSQESRDVSTARLNEAKSILKSLEKRANLLLHLHGGPPANANKSLPAGFLMEMMELRQTIEEEMTSPAGLEKWQKWGEQERSGYELRLRSLFETLEKAGGAGGIGGVGLKIREELNALRYIERLIEQLDPRYKPSGS